MSADDFESHFDPHFNPQRRRLLQQLMTGSALASLMPVTSAVVNEARKPRYLILLQLDGGNDGLNTVVPYSQQTYYRARPGLAIAKDSLHKLDEHLGLHPMLTSLMNLWREKDLHIVLGVGYDNPNRSHFRSTDIWHTASASDQNWSDGWLANQLAQRNISAEGIAFGGDYGPLTGSTRSLVIDNPETFAKQARMVREVALKTDNQADNKALAHIISVRRQITSTLSELKGVLATRQKRRKKARGSELYKQLVTIGDLIEHRINVPVFRARLKGFDTHFYQPNRHQNLMKDLANSLSMLRERLKASGNWDNTLIMTYSEFGRRPAENGSRGTDHGTAAPVFLIGGRVKGGFSGKQPDFPIHKEKDLEHTVDFKRVYRTVADHWLQVDDLSANLRNHAALDVIKRA